MLLSIALRLGLDPEIITHAHQVTYDEVKDYGQLKTHKQMGPKAKVKKAKKPKKISTDSQSASRDHINKQREASKPGSQRPTYLCHWRPGVHQNPKYKGHYL